MKRSTKARVKRNLSRWRIDLAVKVLLALIALIEHWPWAK
jgi:hypothetical protein